MLWMTNRAEKKTAKAMIMNIGTYFIPPFSLPVSISPMIRPEKNVVTTIDITEKARRKSSEIVMDIDMKGTEPEKDSGTAPPPLFMTQRSAG